MVCMLYYPATDNELQTELNVHSKLLFLQGDRE